MNLSVVLPRFPYWQCLDDLADCLAHALVDAGHDVHRESVFGAHPGAVEIVIGAHSGAVKLPDYPVVIYQTELPGTSWFTPNYKARLASALCVWDAVPESKTGHAVLEPGLYPSQAAAVAKDIDLLFYGSLSEYRVATLSKLSDAGLNIEAHFGVFGAERNALIDRSKVIVDVKQRQDDPDDLTRTFFLDSRGACVLTENDQDKLRALDSGRVVEQCRWLLSSDERRARHAKARRDELRLVDVGPAIAALEAAIGKPVQRAPANGAAHHPV